MMLKKTDTLLFKFALIFIVFTVVALSISGAAAFFTQTNDYKKQCGENIRKIGSYLSELMEEDSEEIINCRKFFLENFDNINDIDIPIDFTEYDTARHEFEDIFEEKYNGQTLGGNIYFDDLDKETQTKYFIYVYEKWVLAYESAREAFNIPYTYFVVPNEDESRAMFLVGGQRRPKPENEKMIKLDEMYMNTLDQDEPDDPESDDYILFFKTYRTKQVQDEYQLWDNEYGTTYTYFTPLNIGGECLGVVGTEVDVEYVNQGILSNSIKITIAIAAILVFCSLITLIFIGRSYIRKIKRLESDVREFSENKDVTLAEEITQNASGRNEIASLSLRTAEMVREIDRHMTDIRIMTTEKERITAELNVASKMQSDLLPKEFPKRDDIEIYATMDPAKEMGGDFYDFFFIDSDHLALVMADVSGKGLPAAMFMIAAKTLIKSRAVSRPGTPSQILFDVNNALCEDNPSGLFVTAWLGILTLSDGRLIFANAGHEYPAVMLDESGYKLIMNDNMPPLAAMEGLEFPDEEIVLPHGGRLFLYTDGVPEAKADDSSRFGTDRMLELLNKNKQSAPQQLLFKMKQELDGFSENAGQFDDTTMMNIIRN